MLARAVQASILSAPVVATIGGSIYVAGGFLAIGLAGLFTFKSKMGAYWHEAYKEQQARGDDFEEKYNEQRELKHTALSELAGYKLKTDLSILVDAMSTQRIQITGEIAALRAEITGKLEVVNEALTATAAVLRAMETRLGERATTPKPRTKRVA